MSRAMTMTPLVPFYIRAGAARSGLARKPSKHREDPNGGFLSGGPLMRHFSWNFMEHCSSFSLKLLEKGL